MKTHVVTATAIAHAARCDYCGAEIAFHRSNSGSFVPLHVESKVPTKDGRFRLQPHSSHCPDAEKFRKRPKRGGARGRA